MEPIQSVEQTGTESNPSQTTEPEVKPIQREEEAIGAVFSKFDEAVNTQSVQETPERKEETKSTENQTSGQQAEAPAHWSEEDKAVFKTQPKEVQEFILRRNKALESDYGRKTQQLAEQRRQLEALSFLEQKMKQDPGFRDHVLSFGQQERQQSQAKPDKDNPPEDPIEQIIWKAEQNVMNRLKAEEDKKAALTYQDRINKTAEQAQADPEFEAVQSGIMGFIKVLPAPLQPVMYQHLDSNPDAYMETFNMVKNALAEQKKAQGKAQQPNNTQQQPERRETVKKPLIEQSGISAEANTESKRFKDIKRRASEGDLHAIGAMFDFK